MTGDEPPVPVVIGAHEHASEGRFDRNEANEVVRFDENEESAQGRFDQNEESAQGRFDRNEANEVVRFDENELSAQGRFERNEHSAHARYERNEANEVGRFAEAAQSRIDLDSAAESAASNRYLDLVEINRELRHRVETLIRMVGVGGRTVAVFCGLVILLAAAVWMKIDGQNQDAEKSRAVIAENTGRIRDCTDPTGKCFKDGQARTAAAIAQLNQFNRLSVGCAKAIAVGTPPDVTLAAIDRCIAARTPKAKPAQ